MGTPFGLLDLSAPESRRPGAALIAGIAGGLTSGAVKMAWEAWFPPRKPDREIPPAILLKQRDIDPEQFSYEYNGNEVQWAGLAVHFGFSVATIAAYALATEFIPKVKVLNGIPFGLGVWFVAHEVALPALKLSPKATELPIEETLSELFGHIAWILDAEWVRRDLRQRISGVPDAETRQVALQHLASTARAGAGQVLARIKQR